MTLEQRVPDCVPRPRLFALLMGIFAGLALVLAAVEIYGVLSYQVAQSTREIGIRMAFGASRARLIGKVLGQAGLLILTGIALGLGGAYGNSVLLHPKILPFWQEFFPRA